MGGDGAPPPGGRRRHLRHQGEGGAVLFPAATPIKTIEWEGAMTSSIAGLKVPRHRLAACDVPRGGRSCPRRYVRLESIATSSEERRPLQSYRSGKHWRVQFTRGIRMNDGEVGERRRKWY